MSKKNDIKKAQQRFVSIGERVKVREITDLENIFQQSLNS